MIWLALALGMLAFAALVGLVVGPLLRRRSLEHEAAELRDLARAWDAEQADEFVMPLPETLDALAAMHGKSGRFAKAYAAASSLDGAEAVNRADRRAIARNQRRRGR